MLHPTPHRSDPFRYHPATKYGVEGSGRVGIPVARPTNRLSARFVQSAPAGYHADGAGLYLLVTPERTASWVLRYTFKGRKREMGLGSAAVFSLADARQRAVQQRKLLADGIDPIEARRLAHSDSPRLWGEAVEDFISAHAPGWKSEAQAAQWRQSLGAYGPDKALPVAALDTARVVKLLRGIWSDKTETATRVRGRIERIWDAEKVAGHVAGENPARWKGHLAALLPKPSKVRKPKHHAAMPYADVPAFMAKLRERDGLARKALEFTILTAARTGEVTGATRGEFDLKRKLWTVPGERMKGGRLHVVPLSEAAVAMVPKGERPFPLSENGMLALLQKDMGQPFTVHGFRSSFRDWAAETTDFPSEVVEMALAHAIENKTEAAYRRGSLLDKRRELMDAWAAYLSRHPSALG